MFSGISNQIKQLNQRKNEMSSLEKSRFYFIIEGITGIGQFSLTTGAYLAGFVSFLGGNETLNGMLGVVPAAAGIFQIFSTLLLRGGKSRKEQTIKIVVFLRFFLASIYFVPFIFMNLGFSKNSVLMSFIMCFIFAFVLNGLVSPMITGWLVDVSPMNIRGKYLAFRDRISLATIALSTIVLGRVLDYEKALNKEFSGFIYVGIVLSIMGILNVYSVIKMDDISTEAVNRTDNFLRQLIMPLRDFVFRRVVLLYILWNVALFSGGPFIAVYMVEKLELSYTFMMTMTVVATVVRVIFAPFWGAIADRKSWFQSAGHSLLMLGITHFLWGFVTKGNSWIMVPLLHITVGFAWAGVAISLFNIQFLFAKNEIRTMSIGVNAAISGIVSIIAVKISGFIVDMGDIELPFIHSTISSMRITFIISGVLIMSCTLYIKYVLEPMKDKMTN